MKRIALVALIALMSLTGFAQMIAKGDAAKKKIKVIKKQEAPQPQSAVVDFNSTPATPPSSSICPRWIST